MNVERLNKIYYEIDKYNKFYNKDIQANKFINVVEAFRKQEHSGASANYALTYLKSLIEDYDKTSNMLKKMLEDKTDDTGLQKIVTHQIYSIYDMIRNFPKEEQSIALKLLSHTPLTPLLGTDDEWEEWTTHKGGEDFIGYKQYSNKRNSGVYKYVFDNGIEIAYYLHSNSYSDNGGANFFGTGKFPKKQITFPFDDFESHDVYLYEYAYGKYFELTDPETIKKVRENYESSLK